MKAGRLLIAVALLIGYIANAACGQETKLPPQVDTPEVHRRGTGVTIVGEGPRSGDEVLFNAALAPPPDDNHQWLITLWTTKDCQQCDALKADFQRAPELRAFIEPADVTDPKTGKTVKRAWGQFNVYAHEDETQAFRRKAYKITSYPTLIIQPPRNGAYGGITYDQSGRVTGALVIMQEAGYKGNPKAYRDLIVTNIRRYTKKLSDSGFHPPAFAVVGPQAAEDEGRVTSGGLGQRVAPFAPPPVVDPFSPLAPPAPAYPNYQPGPGYPYGPAVVPSFPPPEPPPSPPVAPKPADPAPNPTPAPDAKPGFLSGLMNPATWAMIGVLVLLGFKIAERVVPLTPTKADDVALAVARKLWDALYSRAPSGPVPVPFPVPTNPPTNPPALVPTNNPAAHPVQ